MSNHLAIATATASLRRSLQGAVTRDVPGANVTTLRPDAKGPPGNQAAVNIYLYQVEPNGALRNHDLPNRSPDGRLVGRPRVALDLRYLITCYGNERELEPQRLLGSVVRALHARPVLTDRMIQDTVSEPSNSFLAGSDLAADVEMVKLTPAPLTLEELSKIWSVFFQTPYALSVAYDGTVVFVETDDAPTSPLPVLRPDVYVLPFGEPVIERVRGPGGPRAPIMARAQVTLEGRGLRGDDTVVRVGNVEVTPQSVSESEIEFALPADLRAGVHAVQVVHRVAMGDPPRPRPRAESNVAAFVLAPRVSAVTVSNRRGTGAQPRSANLTLTVDPRVRAGQRVVLLLNELVTGPRQPASFTFTAPPPASDTASVTVPVRGLPAGTYLVRLRVDGAESPLTVDDDPASPTFERFANPRVTIS